MNLLTDVGGRAASHQIAAKKFNVIAKRFNFVTKGFKGVWRDVKGIAFRKNAHKIAKKPGGKHKGFYDNYAKEVLGNSKSQFGATKTAYNTPGKTSQPRKICERLGALESQGSKKTD